MNFCPKCGELCETEDRYEVEGDKEYAYAVSTCCGAVMAREEDFDEDFDGQRWLLVMGEK